MGHQWRNNENIFQQQQQHQRFGQNQQVQSIQSFAPEHLF
jgi:hypothetical protein